MELRPTYLAILYLVYLGRPLDAQAARSYGGPDRLVWPDAFPPLWDAPEFLLQRPASVEEQVHAVYRRLFNRDAEAPALAAWVGEVQAGRVPLHLLPLAIPSAARNDDVRSIFNKWSAALVFFQHLDTPAERAGFSGEASAAVARAFLQSVGSDDATLSAARDRVDAVIAEAVAQGSRPPGLYFLTTQRDVATPSAASPGWTPTTGADDQFVLDSRDGQPAVGQGDLIDGGGGTDALWLLFGAEALSTAADRYASVELAHLRIRGAGSVDLSGAPDLRAVDVSEFQDFEPPYLANPRSLELRGISSDVQVIAQAGRRVPVTIEFSDRHLPDQTVVVHGGGVLALPEIEHLVFGETAYLALTAPQARTLKVTGGGSVEVEPALLAPGAVVTFDVGGSVGNGTFNVPFTLPAGGSVVVERASGGGLLLDGTVTSVTTHASGEFRFRFDPEAPAGRSVEITAAGSGAIHVAGLQSQVAIRAHGSPQVDYLLGSRVADTFTGGGGADNFVFYSPDAVATDVAGLIAAADTITDLSFADRDRIWVGSAAGEGAAAAAPGVARIVGGIATFHAADASLEQKVEAVVASLRDQGEFTTEFAFFTHGADSWLFANENEAALGRGDVLVRLAGVQMDASHFVLVDRTIVVL